MLKNFWRTSEYAYVILQSSNNDKSSVAWGECMPENIRTDNFAGDTWQGRREHTQHWVQSQKKTPENSCLGKG